MPPSQIEGCRLKGVVLADGCRLYDAEIEECVIGLRSVVRPGARLRRVVMMGADFYETEDQKAENRRLGRPHVGIGEETHIERAIIDQNTRIGQGVTIRSHEGEEDQDGQVSSVNVITDRETGRPRGFEFVEMMTDEGASAAIRALDGQDMDGRALKVSEAKPRAPRDGDRGHRDNPRY